MTRRGSLAWSAAAFAALLAAGGALLMQQRARLVAERRVAASARATAAARDIERHVASCTGAADVLAMLVRAHFGDVRLDEVGPDLLRTYTSVWTLQLQPGGVIRDVFPLEGNEAALGGDLFQDPSRRDSAAWTRDSRRPTVDGPRPLLQGGFGAVVRVPVFLPLEGGDEMFWGFTAATARFDDLLRASRLDAMEAAGYRWALTSPSQPPLGSPSQLADPVHVELDLPNARWQLAVAAEAGWVDGRALAAALAGIALLSAGFAALLYRLLRHPEELRRKVRERTEALERASREREALLAGIREAEERFRQLVENGSELFWMAERGATALLYASPAFARVWGELPGPAPDRALLAERVHPEDRAVFAAALAEAAAGRAAEAQYRVAWPDGSLRWIHERTFPVRNARGEPYRVAGLAADVSKRRGLEDAMRQSHKMEAVGQLAGGIAHDFNNLLCVISANCDLLLQELDPEGQAAADAREVREAAARASSLTRQLLAFSRRQVVQPHVLQPGEVVAELSRMLRRLLGERVTLRCEAREDAGRVRADRGQLEQLVMNLVVNARDAMPAGGEIVVAIRGEEVPPRVAARHEGASPGPHVVLEVRDHGCGMDEGTLARAFDPFFTTKVAGKGTGLGLATVYGIVRQSGGFVELESAPGRGTVVRVHLPRCDEEPDAAAPRLPAALGGSERILVVEDEEAVRAVAARALRRLGYVVLEAPSVVAALGLVRGGARVDLLVTDVVMPGGSGPELVERVRAEGFAAPVLFMSGYAADARLRDELGRGAVFIEKPFTAEALAGKVREALRTRTAA